MRVSIHAGEKGDWIRSEAPTPEGRRNVSFYRDRTRARARAACAFRLEMACRCNELPFLQQSIHRYNTPISRLRLPPGPLRRCPRLPSILFIFFSFFLLWRKRQTPRPVPSPSCSPPLDRPQRLAELSISF